MVAGSGYVLLYLKNRVMDPCREEVTQTVPSPDSVVRAQLSERECKDVKPNVLHLEIGFGTEIKAQRLLTATKSSEVKLTWLSETVLEFDGPSSYVIPILTSVNVGGAIYKVKIKRCANLEAIRKQEESQANRS